MITVGARERYPYRFHPAKPRHFRATVAASDDAVYAPDGARLAEAAGASRLNASISRATPP